MFKKELLALVPETKKYIFLNVLFQWLALVVNIVMMYHIALLLSGMFNGAFTHDLLFRVLIVSVGCILLRAIFNYMANRMTYFSAKQVKDKLRIRIYEKLLGLQGRYEKILSTAQIVQVTNEGVEQLESYFGSYLPQFFYAILAPITLFIIFAKFDITIGLVLLIGVWLIPVSIIVVQKWAKKLLSKYWNQYTTMGDTFLENLQGLTTLKIYQADEYRHKLMNVEAEKFRKITMRVLIMQLNSISIMDLVAYGGAALGMLLAIKHYHDGQIVLLQAILVILLAADFFLPMRTLGSYFHIAMNGMAASDKIIKILRASNHKNGNNSFALGDFSLENLSYGYDSDKVILQNINISLKNNKLTSIVGKSGSGKSTLALLLSKQLVDYQGSIKLNGIDLVDIDDKSFREHVNYLASNSYIFSGRVKDNLAMGKNISEEKMWEVLKRVQLADFLNEADGLDTLIEEGASNLSGGQRQRLALARMLLRKSDLFIFDEATSNIDVESEEIILKEIKKLKDEASVLLIAHRLANVIDADNIYVLDKGRIFESGSFEKLMALKGSFYQMFETQKELENSII